MQCRAWFCVEAPRCFLGFDTYFSTSIDGNGISITVGATVVVSVCVCRFLFSSEMIRPAMGQRKIVDLQTTTGIAYQLWNEGWHGGYIADGQRVKKSTPSVVAKILNVCLKHRNLFNFIRKTQELGKDPMFQTGCKYLRYRKYINTEVE